MIGAITRIRPLQTMTEVNLENRVFVETLAFAILSKILQENCTQCITETRIQMADPDVRRKFALFLYATLAHNPRMWLHRMPPEVVAKVPGKRPKKNKYSPISRYPSCFGFLVIHSFTLWGRSPPSWQTS